MPTAFVLMPFGDNFDSVYEVIIKATLEEANFQVSRADDLESNQNILKDVMDGISNADVIVADLTGLNANVFYELGVAHAFNKPFLMITQSIDDVPFDLKSYRLMQYSTDISGFNEIRGKMREFAESFRRGQMLFGNPVTDFYPQHQADAPLSGNVGEGGSKKSLPQIGEAYFYDCGLTLSVHDFRAGQDMSDKRYGASFGIREAALFIVALKEADYLSFGIRDNQGHVQMRCNVTVPEGSYEGTVTFIEIGHRESSYLELHCWLKVPAIRGVIP